jgi:hypothetical protein
MKKPRKISVRAQVAALGIGKSADFPAAKPQGVISAMLHVARLNGRQYMTRTVLEKGARLIRVWREK